MKKATIEKIIEILNESVEELAITVDEKDEDLTEKGMDSMAFIRIVVALEEEFDLEIPDSKLFLPEMNTAGKIYSLITALQSEGEENGTANNATAVEGIATGG